MSEIDELHRRLTDLEMRLCHLESRIDLMARLQAELAINRRNPPQPVVSTVLKNEAKTGPVRGKQPKPFRYNKRGFQ